MVLTDPVSRRTDVGAGPRASSALTRLGLVALVALVASPVVVAALSLVGDTWIPAGDWAAMAHRVSQVGTSETPLVGLYSREHAHPGPLGVWAGAPLWRLTGGDTRSLAWTAATVNVVVIATLAAVAWRCARWPLVLAVMATAGILARGFGPATLTDLWNPYLPLLAFLLTIVLVWQAALGHRRALVAAVVPATVVLQSHIGYLPLLGLLAAWAVLWVGRWSPPAADADDGDLAPAPPSVRETWGTWATTVRRAGLVAVVLWLPAIVDAVVGQHNPWRIAKGLGSPGDAVGVVHAVGVVGRYVRPDGPWMGGVETPDGNIRDIPGSGPLPLVIAVVVLVTAALIVASAFFVIIEFALLGARRHRLEAEAPTSRSARSALRGMNELTIMLAGAQLGITAATFALGAITKPAVDAWLGPALAGLGVPGWLAGGASFGISLLFVTFLHLVIGEMAPKSWAIAHPERAAKLVSPPARAYIAVVRPLLEGVNSLANRLVPASGVTPVDRAAVGGQDAATIQHLVEHSARSGTLPTNFQRQIHEVIDLERLTLGELVPTDQALTTVTLGSTAEEQRLELLSRLLVPPPPQGRPGVPGLRRRSTCRARARDFRRPADLPCVPAAPLPAAGSPAYRQPAL